MVGLQGELSNSSPWSVSLQPSAAKGPPRTSEGAESLKECNPTLQNQIRKPLSVPLQPKSHYKYYKLKLLTPIGLHPFKNRSDRGLSKIFLFPMKFFHLGPHYIPKVYYICRTNYEILGQKVTKRQKVRSISQLFLHCVYIPKTRGNPENLTPFSFLRGAPFAWGSLNNKIIRMLTNTILEHVFRNRGKMSCGSKP